MHADFDLEADGSVTPRKVKFRDGRGRPKGYSQRKAKDIADGNAQANMDGDDADVTDLSLRKARAMASKTEADAANAWLKHKIDSGEYLSRVAFREACATMLSELAQALRSLPDALERRHGLAPEVVQAVEATIDETLASAASSLEMFVQSPKEPSP